MLWDDARFALFLSRASSSPFCKDRARKRELERRRRAYFQQAAYSNLADYWRSRESALRCGRIERRNDDAAISISPLFGDFRACHVCEVRRRQIGRQSSQPPRFAALRQFGDASKHSASANVSTPIVRGTRCALKRERESTRQTAIGAIWSSAQIAACARLRAIGESNRKILFESVTTTTRKSARRPLAISRQPAARLFAACASRVGKP